MTSTAPGDAPGTGFLPVPGVVSRPDNFAGTGSVKRGQMVLTGFSVKETTGAAAAELDVWDGNGINGQFVTSINLLAGESVRELLPNVRIARGLFVNVTAGAVLGALYTTEAYG